jgi:hypothetical protein
MVRKVVRGCQKIMERTYTMWNLKKGVWLESQIGLQLRKTEISIGLENILERISKFQSKRYCVVTS